MKEIWKDIIGYDGLYEVSNTGKVRSTNYRHTGKIKEISPGDKGNGYLFVDLWKERKRKRFYIHRLVVQAFIGEIPKGLVVNHKDENPSNNNVDNLEICTYTYNANYGTRNQRAGEALKGKTAWNKGKQHSPEARAKMSESHKGKNISPETCVKISERLKGKPWSQARRDAQNKQISHLTRI